MGQLQPINIFLRQEIDRMQKVITLVRTTLMDLKLAIDGTIIMSENLRDALDNMFDARVPTNWKKISWESATLGFWFTDLLDRNQQFSTWLFDGRPTSFWMTGFFNPQVGIPCDVYYRSTGWDEQCIECGIAFHLFIDVDSIGYSCSRLCIVNVFRNKM